jgi:Ca-activated chloride channel family protein
MAMGKALVRALALAAYVACSQGQAIAADEDRNRQLEESVVVTGSFVTQGGAKDVNFLRGEVSKSRIPHPNTFTAEGLLSEHNLVLESERPCAQLFCLIGESIDASLIAQPDAKYLVGLGFATNVSEKTWQRAPLNLVAVVDRSGSMQGTPIDLVRKSLTKVLNLLEDGDQVSIVVFNGEPAIWLAPTSISERSRRTVLERVRSIESDGSTNLEGGLAVGYEIARQTAQRFDGSTRLMVFTDEQPNVGNTLAGGFMDMARAASRDGIGLTTVGVGVQFDAQLATEIGSVRGGNLFYLRDAEDVATHLGDELDFLVSELAHDVTIDITPDAGYSVAAVYGVPGELMGWQNERTVRITIPTVFFSSKGGAIFVALAQRREATYLPTRAMASGAPLAHIELAYSAIDSATRYDDRLDVVAPAARPGEAMRLGHLLIDEFAVLHGATSAHYLENDPERAFRLTQALATKLKAAGRDELDQERELVYGLEEKFAFLSGHASEHTVGKSGMARLWGAWEVRSRQGHLGLNVREKLVFTPDNRYARYLRTGERHALQETSEFGATRRQIQIDDSGVVYDYEVRGPELVLADGSHQNLVFLARSRPPRPDQIDTE